MEPRLTITFYNTDTDDGEDEGPLTVKDLVVTTHTGQRFSLKCNDLGLVITAVGEPSIDVVSRPSPNTLAIKAV